MEPTVTFQVQFSPRLQPSTTVQPEPDRQLSRVTRLLVLAHTVDGMIRAGEVRDWADAARLAGVTRARMTQIANLFLLAPEIQEAILSLPRGGRLTERHLRPLTLLADWQQQREVWRLLVPSPAHPAPAHPRSAA